MVHGAEEGTLVALIVRGDHELNEIKAANQPLVASPLVFASEAEIRAAIGAGPGSLGPVNLPIACIVDRSVALMSDFAAGANIEDKHYFGVNWERDLPLPEVADLRNVVEGDPSPDGKGTLVIKRGIEVGHIFQLGTKYSEAMKLSVLSEQGKPVNLIMGCYGIGVSRVVAGAVRDRPGTAEVRNRERQAGDRQALCRADRSRFRSAAGRSRQEDQPRGEVRRHGADRHSPPHRDQRPRPQRRRPGIQGPPRQRVAEPADRRTDVVHHRKTQPLSVTMPTGRPLRLFAAALCGGLLLSGCANQLPQRSEHEERVERKLLEHTLQVDVGQPDVLELPQRRVRINDQKSFEVTEFEVTRRYDRYTPYQAWREIYEIPLGAVALVAGVGANIVNVVTFGSVPDNITHGWINYGLAGVNPFMNVESNGRAEQNLASIDEKQRDKRLEYSSLPWAERPVLVSSGKELNELLTDRHGVLRLNLLDSPFAEQDISRISQIHLSVSDPQDGTRADASLRVSRSLRGKLLEAHALIYDDLEGDDVHHWVHRVKRLAELGLEEEASELEQSLIELTRNDPELQQQFMHALLRDAGRLAADPGETP